MRTRADIRSPHRAPWPPPLRLGCAIVGLGLLTSCFPYGWAAPQPARRVPAYGAPAAAAAQPKQTFSAADIQAYAPPDGLPDMRPIIGMDPNHWMPAFMPPFTKHATQDEVLAALTDFEQLEISSLNSTTWVYMRPKDPRRYQGLSWFQLAFMTHREKPGPPRLYDIKLHFDRKIRFQPAFKQYLAHLCRLNYGAISSEKEREDIITIFSDHHKSGGSIQLTSQHGEIELNVNAPRAVTHHRRPRALPPPAYAEVVRIDPADYAPPEGMPDLRRWLGVDPDHDRLTFLPRLTRAANYEEVMAAFGDFRKVRDYKKKDYRSVELIPKKAEPYVGIKKIALTFMEDEDLPHLGFYSIKIELASPRGKRDAFHGYVAKLVELNYGGGPEPEKLDRFMGWSRDHGGRVSLHNYGSSPLSLEFTVNDR